MEFTILLIPVMHQTYDASHNAFHAPRLAVTGVAAHETADHDFRTLAAPSRARLDWQPG